MAAFDVVPIVPKPGIMPVGDGEGRGENPGVTDFWVYGDKVRFVGGWPESFRGTDLGIDGTAFSGTARTMEYYVLNNVEWTFIGTSHALYAVGVGVANITPLQTSSTAIANSLDSTSGSPTLTVNAAAHGLIVGDRVKLAGAADFAGWTAATQINKEHIIVTVPTSGKFTVTLTTNATSTVSGGGGASTVYYKPIDVSDGTNPTIWSFDQLNNKIICTPGNGRGIYEWAGDTATAPTLVTNAPTASNRIFVMNGKLVSLYGNNIKNARSGDYTNWTVAVGFDAYDDDKEEADAFISHCKIGNRVVLFTASQVFALDDVGGDDVWQFTRLTRNTGILGPNCAYEVDGIVYFMAPKNIYRLNGSLIQPILEGVYTTNYIAVKTNNSHEYESFISYVPKSGELYFHIAPNPPSSDGKYIGYSTREGWLAPDGSMARTAMLRYNSNVLWGMDLSNNVWVHDDTDYATSGEWDGNSLLPTITTNWRSLDGGKTRALIHGLELAGEWLGILNIKLEYKNDFMSDAVGIWSSYATQSLGYSSPDPANTYNRRMFIGPISTLYWRWTFSMPANTPTNFNFFMRIAGFKEYVQRQKALW